MKNIVTSTLLAVSLWSSYGSLGSNAPVVNAAESDASSAMVQHDDVTKPSTVLQFTLPQFVEGRYDVRVTLYLRNGQVSMGYAQVPDRDNMLHRIDTEPSAPIAFVWAKDGKEIDVPESARGS
ncbi:MAG: hypothetical protein MJH10_21725, partial [Epibacterium sp.]|nr:hypothetical protein [Epibacterium sp.]NQX76070.1 hypothetical protein [Epibacterium sp.]